MGSRENSVARHRRGGTDRQTLSPSALLGDEGLGRSHWALPLRAAVRLQQTSAPMPTLDAVRVKPTLVRPSSMRGPAVHAWPCRQAGALRRATTRNVIVLTP